VPNGSGKNRRNLTVLDRDTPAKEAKPVKHPSLINAVATVFRQEDARKKSLANLPRCEKGLAVLREIRRAYPGDSLMTTDIECHSLKSLEMTEIAPADTDPLGAHIAPDPAKPLFRRLQVRVISGHETVSVANIPDSPAGRELLLKLMREYPDSDFLTTDFGWHRFREIIRPSIDELNKV
jgi:hypothetical protein